jgi:hypothetical protein
MQDAHTTHVRARPEVIDRRFERRPGKAKLFRQTQQQHDPSGMNCPSGVWILFHLKLGHRL